jgi:RNA polymerase sigma-70 factor (ECF subfamily)
MHGKPEDVLEPSSRLTAASFHAHHRRTIMSGRTSSPIGRSFAALSYGQTVRSADSESSFIPPALAKLCPAADGNTAPATRSRVSGVNVSVFVDMRPRLFAIAYRILGNAAEAEDVVQDAWLRWQTSDRSVVLNAPAYLATTTTRLAINLAQSARLRREVYFGTWPEPVDPRLDPQSEVEQGEALEHAVLVLLSTLSPKERAAYVLREAFNYPYRQIAGLLQLAEANARQLVARARKRVADNKPRPTARSAEGQRLLDAFIAAAQKGDLSTLEEHFASDIAC